MTNDIASELARLHTLTGADFSRQVERIALRGEFHPLEGEVDIYTTGGEQDADYNHLLNAARKAVFHGYRVFILPNPKGIRTADFIFERKGTYRLYDLKTIQGKASAQNRLMESIGQCNRILFNIATDYPAASLARSIKRYFEHNGSALEVLIFKGKKVISISREFSQSSGYYKMFMRKYLK